MAGLFDQATLDKIVNIRDKLRENNNPLVRYCSNVKCNARLVAPNFDAMCLTCEKCNQQTCFQCVEPWHGNDVTCEQAFVKQLGKQNKNTRISYCAMCKLKVQRTAGCRHMTCKCCGYEWCWDCGQDYYSYHCIPGAQDPGEWFYEWPHSEIAIQLQGRTALQTLIAVGFIFFQFTVPWFNFYTAPCLTFISFFSSIVFNNGSNWCLFGLTAIYGVFATMFTLVLNLYVIPLALASLGALNLYLVLYLYVFGPYKSYQTHLTAVANWNNGEINEQIKNMIAEENRKRAGKINANKEKARQKIQQLVNDDQGLKKAFEEDY